VVSGGQHNNIPLSISLKHYAIIDNPTTKIDESIVGTEYFKNQAIDQSSKKFYFLNIICKVYSLIDCCFFDFQFFRT
jgi:hypothetical protein